MTKSSTGTLFVFLALLVCYLPKNVFVYLVCYPVGQTTPALQSDAAVCEFVV